MRITKREWSLELSNLREVYPDASEASIIGRHGISAVATQIDIQLREILSALPYLSSKPEHAMRALLQIARLATMGTLYMRKEYVNGRSERNSQSGEAL